MKKILSFLMVIAITLFAFVSCEQSTPAPEAVPETDMYGVQIGTIENYQGLDATVTIQSEAVTRAGYMDQLYTISIDKPGKEALNFLLTIEEFPEENKIVVTQYDEFWNEIVAMTYIDNRFADIVIYDAPSDTRALTRGWLRDLWDCTAKNYKSIEEKIEADPDLNLFCDVANIYFGMCTVASVIKGAYYCL